MEDERIRLIPNANTGGSGGFARGLREAMRFPELTFPPQGFCSPENIFAYAQIGISVRVPNPPGRPVLPCCVQNIRQIPGNITIQETG